jgi:hypothetical protein
MNDVIHDNLVLGHRLATDVPIANKGLMWAVFDMASSQMTMVHENFWCINNPSMGDPLQTIIFGQGRVSHRSGYLSL